MRPVTFDTFEITLLVNKVPLKERGRQQEEGKTTFCYVDLQANTPFTVRFHNGDQNAVWVKLSVDGQSLNGKGAGVLDEIVITQERGQPIQFAENAGTQWYRTIQAEIWLRGHHGKPEDFGRPKGFQDTDITPPQPGMPPNDIMEIRVVVSSIPTRS